MTYGATNANLLNSSGFQNPSLCLPDGSEFFHLSVLLSTVLDQAPLTRFYDQEHLLYHGSEQNKLHWVQVQPKDVSQPQSESN